MTREELEKHYWNYYLILEEKFINTRSFVELDEHNFDTFSNEYSMLLQAIGNEVNSFLKVYYSNVKDNMKYFFKEIVSKDRELISYSTILQTNDNLVIEPFIEIDSQKPNANLEWWESYNKLKHSRVKNMQSATLKNTITALSALFLLEMNALIKIANLDNGLDSFQKASKLFLLKGYKIKAIHLSDAFAISVDD